MRWTSVHSATPVAAIAEALGFEEATNFLKFFKRETALPRGHSDDSTYAWREVS